MLEMCAGLTMVMRTSIEKLIEARYEMAMMPAHFLAIITHPQLKGESLKTDETDEAMNFATEANSGLIPIILNYKAKSPPFSNYMFDAIDVMQREKNVLSVPSSDISVQESRKLLVDVTPLSWWTSLSKHIDKM